MFRSILIFLSATSLVGARWVNLWPAAAPGAKPRPAGSEQVKEGNGFTDIEIPQYQVYPANKEKATGAAVLILPGAGYGMLAAGHEVTTTPSGWPPAA